jgi:hypothetical protein
VAGDSFAIPALAQVQYGRPIHALIVRALLPPGFIFLCLPLAQAFLEPVMSVRFGIERINFNVARAFIMGDSLAQYSICLKPKDGDTRFTGVSL